MSRVEDSGGSRPASARLFKRSELRLKPTGQARLRALARRPLRPPTVLEAQREEDDAVMRRLRGWGRELAQRFRLRWSSLQREREGVNGHYGICYEDGTIRIRLRHAKTGRLLKESSLVDTLCHELAHLRHMDHSIRFRRLYERILDEARALGYYRPGRQDCELQPTQLALFGEGCGTPKKMKTKRPEKPK